MTSPPGGSWNVLVNTHVMCSPATRLMWAVLPSITALLFPGLAVGVDRRADDRRQVVVRDGALGDRPRDRLAVELLAGAEEVLRPAVAQVEAVRVVGEVAVERERRGRADRLADDLFLDRDLAGGRRRLDVDAVAEDVLVPRGEVDVLDVVAVEVVCGAPQRPEAVLGAGKAADQDRVTWHSALCPQRAAVARLLALGVGELGRGRAVDRLATDLLSVLVQQRRRILGRDGRVKRVGDL